MGQCSSTSKKQKSKLQDLSRIDVPMAEEAETDDDIVEPQIAGPTRQRRAIDDRCTGFVKGDERVSQSGRDAFLPVQHPKEDFGLAAIRPSLDDSMCTALLALRMGRGSSVGGLATSGSFASTDARNQCGQETSLAPLPENMSEPLPEGDNTTVAERPKGKASAAAEGGASLPSAHLTHRASECRNSSIDGLQVLLGPGAAPPLTTAPRI